MAEDYPRLAEENLGLVHLCAGRLTGRGVPYEELIAAGIKIYTYTPGFIHSKTFVADDDTAVVGSINLDYRSLYLHFECGCWMYKTASVMQVKQDALNTFEISREIDLDFCRNRNIAVRGFQAILRLIAPTL